MNSQENLDLISKIISGDEIDFTTNTYTVEPAIFVRRNFINRLPKKYLEPLYKRIAKQNDLVYENAKGFLKIEDTIDDSLNWN